MPNNYKILGEHCIKVKAADYPSNIKWENVILYLLKLSISNCEERCRYMVFLLVITISLLITSGVVIAGSVFNVKIYKIENFSRLINQERCSNCNVCSS